MSRSRLIKYLKEKNPKLNRSELEIVLDSFSESVFNTLVSKKNIEIRGFGRFYIKKLKENFNLRNPKNNELIYSPERAKVRFKASRKLNKLINE